MANRLLNESSPGLRQHAHDPVAWYPWGPEALDLAARTHRPILLAVGHAGCSSMRRLQQELFASPLIAREMNEAVVCVMVDWDERPDVARLYGAAMGQPFDRRADHALVVFLTPTGAPFQVEVPYTSESGAGSHSFEPLLARGLQLWRDHPVQLQQRTEALTRALRGVCTLPSPKPITPDWSRRLAATTDWTATADRAAAPLPHPNADLLSALLLDWYLHRDPSVEHGLRRTLDLLAHGDDTGHHARHTWDLARMAVVFADAAAAFSSEPWAQVAVGIGDRVLRERRLASGGVAHRAEAPVVTLSHAAMISAWARLGAATEPSRFLEAAQQGAAFAARFLVDGERLLHSGGAPSGHRRVPAFADDHAALIHALVDLYQVTGNLHWLDRAQHWADTLLDLFWDQAAGGLFYTGRDVPPLVVRAKHPSHGSEVDANTLAATALGKLGLLTGQRRFSESAEAILSHYQAWVEADPHAMAHAMPAAAWHGPHTSELAIIGDPSRPDTRAMRAVFHRRYRPLTVLAPVSPEDLWKARIRIPWLANRAPHGPGPKAWLCSGQACHIPATSAERLLSQLLQTEAQPTAAPS